MDSALSDGGTQAETRRRGPVHRHDLLRLATITTVVCTVALIALGSTVRVTESGMGCSSWPLCNGQIGPIDRFHALMEQSHRYLVAVVSVLVVVNLVLAWRRRLRQPDVLLPATAATGLLVVQVMLGALTVFAHNAGWTVGVHMVCAQLLLAAVAVTAWRATHPHRASVPAPAAAAGAGAGSRSPGPKASWPPGPRAPWPLGAGRAGVAMLALLVATLIAGATVVDSGAEQACPSWPLCPAGASGHLVAIQLVHRGIAAAAGVAVLVVALQAWRRRSSRVEPGAIALVVLLALQGAAGGISAVLRAPAGAADVHLAGATLLWLAGVLVVARGVPASPQAGSVASDQVSASRRVTGGASRPVAVPAATGAALPNRP